MSDCIFWTGAINKDGYGQRGRRFAHRIAYEAVRGPIPKGLVIDHLCFNRACVNVDHLRAVTASENNRRRKSMFDTHCKHGHPFNKQNLYVSPSGHRNCRVCNLAAQRRRMARMRSEVAA